MASWDTDWTLKFIEEYKNTPILWEKNVHNYSNKYAVALNNFALKFGTTMSDVERKINGLRTQYFYYKKYYKAGNYAAKWPYYKHLKFLNAVSNHNVMSPKLPFLVVVKTTPSVENSPGPSIIEKESFETNLNAEPEVPLPMVVEAENSPISFIVEKKVSNPTNLDAMPEIQFRVINDMDEVSTHEIEKPVAVKVANNSIQLPKPPETGRNIGQTRAQTVNFGVRTSKVLVSKDLNGVQHNEYAQYLASEIRAIPDICQQTILKAQIQLLIYKAHQGLLTL